MAQPGYGPQPQGYAVYPQPGVSPGYPQQGVSPGYPQPGVSPGYPHQGGSPGYPQPQSGYPEGYSNQGYSHQGGQPQGYGQYPAATPEGATSLNIGGEEDGFEFTDKSIRRAFIRKVYSILVLQLLLTGGIIGLFYIESFRRWNIENPWLLIASAVATIVLIIALACATNLRRKSPLNIILLLIFTACEGLLLGSVCASYSADEVLMALVTTIVIFVGLTLFAFQTKIDFTIMAGAMFTILWALIMFGFMCLILHSDTLNNLYSVLGAIIFSMYIIIDTQLLMGGKHRYSVSPEEYIFAALSLYLDIVNLFLFLLRLFGNN